MGKENAIGSFVLAIGKEPLDNQIVEITYM